MDHVSRKLCLVQWYRRRRPALSIRRLSKLIYYRSRRSFGKDTSFNCPGPSEVKIDIFMPVVEKDAAILPFTLEAARKQIMHPIGSIYIIAPKDASKVRQVAEKHSCTFIEEEEIAPTGKADINYTHNGENRAGWLLKMLINLSADKVCKQKYILILDADTVFIRPQIFVHNNKPIFNESIFYHEPYYSANMRLFGLKHPSSRSFITHYMLFQADILRDLRSDIEAYNQEPWWAAIIKSVDKSEGSGFADYEVYGDYYVHRRRLPAVINDWLVADLSISNYEKLHELMDQNAKSFGALSLHNYDRN